MAKKKIISQYDAELDAKRKYAANGIHFMSIFDCIGNASCGDDTVDQAKEISYSEHSTKRSGSQNTKKKSDRSESNVASPEPAVAKERGDSKGCQDNSGKTVGVPGKSPRRKGSSGKTDKGGKRDGVSDGGGKDVKVGPKVNGGKIPTGEQHDIGEVKITSFKLRDFADTGNLMAPVYIQYGPREINDRDLVEIVIDGFRYRVSRWSVRDGKYIQGLDSHFLVRHYIVPRKKS